MSSRDIPWQRWRRLQPALVSDCQERSGAMDGRIRRFAGSSLCGPAYPVRTVAGDNRTLHLALTQVPCGAVLVINAEGHLDRAVWGEVLTRAAQAAGVLGLVLDGAVRDVDAIASLDFPLFARAANPAGPHKGWTGQIGGTISCGGVVVAEGDVVLGDGDGIVVVPRERAAKVLEAAEDRAEKEQQWLRRIADGESTADIFGFTR